MTTFENIRLNLLVVVVLLVGYVADRPQRFDFTLAGMAAEQRRIVPPPLTAAYPMVDSLVYTGFYSGGPYKLTFMDGVDERTEIRVGAEMITLGELKKAMAER